MASQDAPGPGLGVCLGMVGMGSSLATLVAVAPAATPTAPAPAAIASGTSTFLVPSFLAVFMTSLLLILMMFSP